jgi:hypothetical protein
MEMGKSGNPCERFIAPTSLARPDITAKMEVPALGSRDLTSPLYFINNAILCLKGKGLIPATVLHPAKKPSFYLTANKVSLIKNQYQEIK